MASSLDINSCAASRAAVASFGCAATEPAYSCASCVYSGVVIRFCWQAGVLRLRHPRRRLRRGGGHDLAGSLLVREPFGEPVEGVLGDLEQAAAELEADRRGGRGRGRALGRLRMPCGLRVERRRQRGGRDGARRHHFRPDLHSNLLADANAVHRTDRGKLWKTLFHGSPGVAVSRRERTEDGGEGRECCRASRFVQRDPWARRSAMRRRWFRSHAIPAAMPASERNAAAPPCQTRTWRRSVIGQWRR